MQNTRQTNELPQGVWFEAERNRYRVRLYKHKRVGFRAYFPTLEQALAAYEQKRHELDNQPPPEIRTEIYQTDLGGIIGSVFQHISNDPAANRIGAA